MFDIGSLFEDIPLIFLGRMLYLLISSSQRWRCFEWAHQCSRQRYCLKLSMNTEPLNIIEWRLFLLVVSALTSWFLSDWQLGLCCSRWTAARTGNCSKGRLVLSLMCLACMGSLQRTSEKMYAYFQNYNDFIFYLNAAIIFPFLWFFFIIALFLK